MPRNRLAIVLLVLAGFIAAAGLAFLVLRDDGPEVVLAAPVHAAPSFSFLAVGDHGKVTDAQGDVAAAMDEVAGEAGDVAFAVFLGDNFYQDGVSGVDDPLWDEVFENRYDGPHLLGMRFFAILGNQDLDGDAQAQIEYARQRRGSARWRMDGRHYQRTFGRLPDGRALAQVVFLDTNTPDDPAQLAFLDAAFASRQALWRLVAGHHPLVSFGPHEDDPELIAALSDRVATGDLYLCGHDHNIQVILPDGDGPLFVVSGGGGRSIDPIDRAPDDTLLFSLDDYGFVRVALDAERMIVRVHGRHGDLVHEVRREAEPWPAAAGAGR